MVVVPCCPSSGEGRTRRSALVLRFASRARVAPGARVLPPARSRLDGAPAPLFPPSLARARAPHKLSDFRDNTTDVSARPPQDQPTDQTARAERRPSPVSAVDLRPDADAPVARPRPVLERLVSRFRHGLAPAQVPHGALLLHVWVRRRCRPSEAASAAKTKTPARRARSLALRTRSTLNPPAPEKKTQPPQTPKKQRPRPGRRRPAPHPRRVARPPHRRPLFVLAPVPPRRPNQRPSKARRDCSSRF
jgi:hypothetical protein